MGAAATKDEAVTKARANKPGLVLADINLGEGGSGIDAVTEILRTFDIPVIFITAYPERLLTGERPEPTYLITKPFLPETVQATIGQALFFHSLRARSGMSATSSIPSGVPSLKRRQQEGAAPCRIPSNGRAATETSSRAA